MITAAAVVTAIALTGASIATAINPHTPTHVSAALFTQAAALFAITDTLRDRHTWAVINAALTLGGGCVWWATGGVRAARRLPGRRPTA